jgi:hypothetical protein
MRRSVLVVFSMYVASARTSASGANPLSVRGDPAQALRKAVLENDYGTVEREIEKVQRRALHRVGSVV